jgi:hypothetical protein
MARRTLRSCWLALLVLVACAGDIVVRIPRQQAPRLDTALAAIAPLAVEVPAASGAPNSADPIGERDAGLGSPRGSIYLTEDAGTVLWRLVSEELRAAGHRVVDADPDVSLAIQVLEFDVGNRSRSLGWDVVVRIRMVLRVAKVAGADDFAEFVYSAERTGRTVYRPGIRSNERVVTECLDDLARLVSERETLAAALERFAREPR